MFISVLDLFKIGIGPSSSHTMGPMAAASAFRQLIKTFVSTPEGQNKFKVRCILKGSLAYTGKGHATDHAVVLGLHGFLPIDLADQDVNALREQLWDCSTLELEHPQAITFCPIDDIVFDRGIPLSEHPNGMIFELIDQEEKTVLTETYFSIGGGFFNTLAEISALAAPLKTASAVSCPYPFDSANAMLQMSEEHDLSIPVMKRLNEEVYRTDEALNIGLDAIWQAMQSCVEKGLAVEGILPSTLR